VIIIRCNEEVLIWELQDDGTGKLKVTNMRKNNSETMSFEWPFLVQTLGKRELVIYPLFLPDVVIFKKIGKLDEEGDAVRGSISDSYLAESLNLFLKMTSDDKEVFLKLNLKRDLGIKPITKKSKAYRKTESKLKNHFASILKNVNR